MPVHPSWNLVDDVRQMLEFHFMVNALRAGSIVAVVAGAIGYVMVLRRQAFAGHTLAILGFPGAAGATWLGINQTFGFFGFCIAAAVVLGLTPGGRSGEHTAVIGIVQSYGLACGLLFVSLYNGFLSGLNNLLFGTIVGITDTQVVILLTAGAVSMLALALLGRPLLYASIDEAAARARGVPTRAVSIGFLVLLGIAAAGASQVTGSLLVFALLVAPAATAVRLTSRPALGLCLSMLIGLVVTWVGAGIAYFSPYPVGFWVTTVAFTLFLLASGFRAMTAR